MLSVDMGLFIDHLSSFLIPNQFPFIERRFYKILLRRAESPDFSIDVFIICL